MDARVPRRTCSRPSRRQTSAYDTLKNTLKKRSEVGAKRFPLIHGCRMSVTVGYGSTDHRTTIYFKTKLMSEVCLCIVCLLSAMCCKSTCPANRVRGPSSVRQSGKGNERS